MMTCVLEKSKSEMGVGEWLRTMCVCVWGGEHLRTISNWYHQEAFVDKLAIKSKVGEAENQPTQIPARVWSKQKEQGASRRRGTG